MKIRKSFVAVLAAVVSMLGMAETATVDGLLWQYSVSEGKATIEKLLTPGVENVVVPSEINDVKVSTIGDHAFMDNTTIKTVVISEGVMTIGQCAFCGCSDLISVTIPSTVSRIRNLAFGWCTKLTTVTIPYGVMHIEDEVFCDCTSLVTATIGASVKEIGIYAFEGCENLISITIPASVQEIGHGAFMRCEKLEAISVNSGNSVYRSLDGVVYDKAGTKLLICPEGKVGLVQIPASVTCIGAGGGNEWTDSTEDTAHQGAFQRCAKLTSISIPAGVTFISEAAFTGCDGLMTISVDSDNPWYCDKNGVLYTKDMVVLFCCPGGVEELTIPSDVSEILYDDERWEGFFALDGKNLKTITVEDGNQSYCADDGILYSKDKTELICCPRGKTGLVTIPYGVTTIGYDAFGDGALTSLTIPPTVTSVDVDAFTVLIDWDSGELYGDGLRNINVWQCDLERVKQLLKGCWAFPIDLLTFNEIMPGSEGARWKVGDEVEAWTNGEGVLIIEGRGDMYGWADSGIRWNGSWPWVDCADAISAVVVCDGVTSIGEWAFGHFSEMTHVALPEGLLSLSDFVFEFCTSLRNITIPASVLSIGEKCFVGCQKLADVYFAGVQVPAIGSAAFDGCSSDILLHAPSGWEGRSRIISGCQLEVEGEPSKPIIVNLSVTNVAVHYVFNSVQPQFAVPASSDMGFVNIITEVKGDCVAVPATWASEYPNFVSKYGSDFTKALTMKSGKKDGAGNEMLVWQDYVAGTDPTDEKDVFTASITIVDGKVTISYTPELDEARKMMRKYTTWGKTSLMDADWTEVQEGHEAEYNFFKVSVEMR